MDRLIISLTTIPPRFKVIHETLQSLVSQSVKPEAIHLYLPKEYRRFQYEKHEVPEPPAGVSIRYVDADFGPATKILPAVQAYQGQDVKLLFCDDDKVYDPDWVQRFLVASKAHPDCCIVEEGGQVSDYSHHAYTGRLQPRSVRRVKDLSYRLKRLLSLGRWKPRKAASSGYVDVLEGWGGVLVRPHFFSDAAFDIPDILWTVDDIWLSGQLALNNIPIWLNADGDIRTKGNSDEVRDASLRKLVYKGHDRSAANSLCIDHFREIHRIWR
jgi:hypothetical protein